MTDDDLRLRYVEGINPSRWLDVWDARHPERSIEHERVGQPRQLRAVLAGESDLAIVRAAEADERLHRIVMFTESTAAIAEHDHPIGAFAELTMADLENETLLDVTGLSHKDAAITAKTGAGIALMPMSVARLYGGKGSTVRVVTDAPGHPVELVWLRERDDDDTQDFAGIVRGRKATSSRAAQPEEEKPKPKPKPKPAHRIPPRARPRRMQKRRGR
ncbi:LysR family transcriptional regulator substrate-binding protein [Agrococcus casei]|uniref:Transcriptional regulator, LysR family, putative n=1 Tax=Agrococcus casei LMG 22410 TaxID=1255656 RepID=A0A1R4F996_9MICO|nr:LysR family transcriptional regulator substrate-binding protein [Agrococcus casei]SJM52437.1 transcriptional regulator, LysR family, putative [Agrococcus casei LMG 22410]